MIFDIIKDYTQICLYRHINPDDDAFGSQFGMYYFLKEYFPDIHIVLMGDFTNELTKKYDLSLLSELKDEKTLGIVLDTANIERVDGDISVCETIIKIDHHIIVDQYGDINIVDEHASSCAEILTLLLSEYQPIPKSAARCLYTGMITDSNRFLYRGTTSKTFDAAKILLSTGIDIEDIYSKLYTVDMTDIEVKKYIYNHYKTSGQVIYYYLSQEALDMLGITRNVGSFYVDTLAHLKEYPIYMALTENIADGNIRVSLRSSHLPVNEVASHFRGGGHALAAGATLSSLDELDELLELLNKVQ